MMYFLDTNVCIRILNGSSVHLIERFEQIDLDDIRIPSIVASELMYGAQKSVKRNYNLNRFRRFLAQFEIIPLNKDAIEEYGIIRAELERRGITIGANDYFIAAIVKSYNGTLVTNNTDEFSRVDGLRIEDWTLEDQGDGNG